MLIRVGKNQLVGDMLCLGGAVLFSITTVLQELTVKTVDIIEYLGMIDRFLRHDIMLRANVSEKKKGLFATVIKFFIVNIFTGLCLRTSSWSNFSGTMRR